MAIKIREQSLQRVFLHYFLAVSGSFVLFLLATVVFFSISLQTGWVIPANQAETVLSDWKTHPEHVNLNQLPVGVTFAQINSQNQIVTSNLSEELQKEAKDYLLDASKTPSEGYFMEISTSNASYLFHYDIKVHYANAFLDGHLPSFEIVGLGLLFLVWVPTFFFLTLYFARYLRQQMGPLGQLTEKIAEQDLDFRIPQTKIKEFNRLLEDLNHMRDSLKESLMANWQQDQAQREQIAALAHDIKTPLTVIKGNTELLSLTDLTSVQQEQVARSLRQIEKVEDYLADLNQLTKAQQLTQLQLKELDSQEVLAALSEEVMVLAEARHRLVEIDDANLSSFSLLVDQAFLTRAFLNILANAFDYSQPDSLISISYKIKNQELYLLCANKGSGFSREALEKGPQLFYRADKSRHDRTHSGVGLYIAEQIAQQHQGRLLIENTTDGCVVGVILPIRKKE